MGINYSQLLRDILTAVCDAKFDLAYYEAANRGLDISNRETIKMDIKKILERYLELVKEELGI